jgi:hypothetical protein
MQKVSRTLRRSGTSCDTHWRRPLGAAMKIRPRAGGGHIVDMKSEPRYEAQTIAHDAVGGRFDIRIYPTCLMSGLALALEGMMSSLGCSVVA